MAITMEQYVEEIQAKQQSQPKKKLSTLEVPQGNEKILEVNFGAISPLTGQPLSTVWMKTGAVVAYNGEVSFSREERLSRGMAHALQEAVTTDGTTLKRATAQGQAQLYLAEQGKIVTIFKLQGDSITVNGHDLLAFEPTVTHRIAILKRSSAILSKGLFNVRLQGHGLVAVMTHGKPICLEVGKGKPAVHTDPDATVLWSGGLTPDFKTDDHLKTYMRRKTNEVFQMTFDGNRGPPGIVLVQPFEEHFK